MRKHSQFAPGIVWLGATLLCTMTPSIELTSAAVHEAGHVVVAYALGRRVTLIRLGEQTVPTNRGIGLSPCGLNPRPIKPSYSDYAEVLAHREIESSLGSG